MTNSGTPELLKASSVAPDVDQYPCVRLQDVYQDAVLQKWPDFDLNVLFKNKISMFEYVNTCRYFGSYNLPRTDEGEDSD